MKRAQKTNPSPNPGAVTTSKKKRKWLRDWEKLNPAFKVGVREGMKKSAWGQSSGWGTDQVQTPGELEAAQSATGLGSTSHQPPRDQAVRGTGKGVGRGVPEWLRILKHLPSPQTWNVMER